jgi:hypothetical protein
MFCMFREERYEFIRAKYVDKKYITRTCVNDQDLLSDLEHAVNNRDLHHLLQVYAENVDLSASLPTSVSCLKTQLQILILSKYIYKSLNFYKICIPFITGFM